ncbi:Dia4 protein [Candida orthopsilosis Co 90-125]|uniref:serine--tRNA ligase n=1 Tax=Candida orthopsilosis (strain 90-125) TaxID=1136231 RepID=H8X9K9_CANO9|nr:Dia4 protein [Candida orthopsilosis Co 90-125]CCG24675.1 Dia4 protein [Candida orthopsilosis Co 90-125]
MIIYGFCNKEYTKKVFGLSLLTFGRILLVATTCSVKHFFETCRAKNFAIEKLIDIASHLMLPSVGSRKSLLRFASTAAKNTSILLRAQLDLNDVVLRSPEYKESITRRQLSKNLIEDVDFIVKNRPIQSQTYTKINALKRERTELAEKIQKKEPNLDEVKARLSEIKSEIKPLEKYVKELQEEIYSKAEALPNLLDPAVPASEIKEELVQYINTSAEEVGKYVGPDTSKDHKIIGERFGLFDFETASRISGPSWYYLLGDGALLEQALVQYALSKARRHGYKMVIPPSIVRSEVVHACGFKPNDQNNEKQIYQIEDEPRSLTGTAEIPLGALHSSTIFPSNTKFPIKYSGVSRSYRAEAGASGKDTKGLYRVHEFTKVELFHFTTLERARDELESVKNFQLEIIEELDLKARLLNMPTSDLGAPAMKKYDIEAWMPGRGSWGELTSCSNCGDYQSRRLGIRFNGKGDKVAHVATLNGTCMAVPRVIVAIIEQNYDQENDVIRIPKVLVPFMDGRNVISKIE